MMESEPHKLALLCVDARIVFESDGTLFCPAWSSYRIFDLRYLKQHATAGDFDDMFPNPTSSEPRFFGAEILVKDMVPLRYIQRIYFPDDDSLDATFETCSQIVAGRSRMGVTIYFTRRAEVFKRPPDHYLTRQRFPPEES